MNVRKWILFLVSVVGSFEMYSQACNLSLSIQSLNITCINNPTGKATVIPQAGIPPYSYLWSANTGFQTNSTAVGLGVGTYSVVVTDSIGCIDSTTVSIVLQPLSAPDICMVSVDDSSVYNVVYYEKTNYSNVDSFIFYRETSPGNYTRIGARPYDSLSRFFDTARAVGQVIGDPNLNSNRYKIQIRDSCGNYSPLSPYHQSLFIVHLGNGNFQWSVPYEIEGATNPVNNYALLCDTANTGGWGPVSTVSGLTNNASDPGYVNHSSIANWRVVTAWNIVCNPSLRQTSETNSMLAVIKSRSNVINNRTAGINNGLLENMLRVYPNPASESLWIEFLSMGTSAKIFLRNSLSQIVNETKIENNQNKVSFETNGLQKGIYFLEIRSDFGSILKKISIQ